ncbi:MAG: thymidylate synthase [Chromatiales bacterium]|nr:thymidylate synthase [Chromatiales bacterium]
MRPYLDLLQTILERGAEKEDRTGVGTYSLFGWQARYQLQDGFPLLTTKRIHFKSVVHELLWFISGDTNTDYLHKHGVSIWDEWADKDGNLGPIYGRQWRAWRGSDGTVDQLRQLLTDLNERPDSRRLIISAWNVGELPYMRLAPCHVLIQFYVIDKQLSCQFYQRSADVFLGVPFNIASYALLTMMIAQVSGLTCGELIHTLGDVHLYKNHVAQAREQLTRTPRTLPTLKLNEDIKDLDQFSYQDIELSGYEPHGPLPAPVAV